MCLEISHHLIPPLPLDLQGRLWVWRFSDASFLASRSFMRILHSSFYPQCFGTPDVCSFQSPPGLILPCHFWLQLLNTCPLIPLLRQMGRSGHTGNNSKSRPCQSYNGNTIIPGQQAKGAHSLSTPSSSDQGWNEKIAFWFCAPCSLLPPAVSAPSTWPLWTELDTNTSFRHDPLDMK